MINKTRHSREGEIRSKTCFFALFSRKNRTRSIKNGFDAKKRIINKQEPKLLKLARRLLNSPSSHIFSHGQVPAIGAAVVCRTGEGLSRSGTPRFRRGLRLSVSPLWTPFAETLFEAVFSEPFYGKVRKWRPDLLPFLRLGFQNREHFWRGLGDSKRSGR